MVLKPGETVGKFDLSIDDAAKKVLFITSTRIGDAVLSTGLLQRLLQLYPKARFTIACGPVCAPLFAAVPRLDNVIPMVKKKCSAHWFELWAGTIGTQWDVVVDLRRSGVAYFLRAGRRYRLQKQAGTMHRVVENAHVLGLQDKPPAPKLWAAKEHLNGAKRRLPDSGVALAVGPTANWAAKTWRPEYFAELIERITGPYGFLPGAPVAVFGAQSEREQAMPVLESIPKDRRIDLVGGVGLLSAYACLERCAFYVGNDSGLMHMAAASRTLTLGLFGPSREEHYAPWGDRAAYVRTKTPFAEIYPPGFDHRNTGTLMDTLTVDMAEDAAWELWEKYHRLPRRKNKQDAKDG